jgi:Glycosyl transferase family 2
MESDIVIGIPCREFGRSSIFTECLEYLERPPRTKILWGRDNSVARARNTIAKEALRQGASAIWWLDDDLLFQPDALIKALRRPEAIVIGLTLGRFPMGGDFRPIWSDVPMQGDCWFPVTTIEVGPNGLMPLVSGTGGGVLTRREVFEVCPAPWWQIGQNEAAPDMFWEDIFFYDLARAHGFQVWGDPEVKFGHDTSVTVWPYQDPDGRWSTVLARGFEPMIMHPWNVDAHTTRAPMSTTAPRPFHTELRIHAAADAPDF